MEGAASGPPSTDEARLVQAAKAGDGAAFAELLRAHDSRMRGLAYRLLGSGDAMDDVLQDAYLKAFRSLHTHDPAIGRFSPWMYRIVHSCAMDHHRRVARRPQIAMEITPAFASVDVDPSTIVARRTALRSALFELPAEQAAVVALVDGEGLSYDEVAETLDISPGTVGSRLNRARAALRQRLTSTTEGELR